jgi:parallel beta-helix repeat protein
MKYNILKRKLVFAIVTLFILSSFIPSFLGEDINKACVKLIFEDGPDIEVGHSGSVDYSFIQDAIDAAEDGDIIWVYSGTYQETLDIIDKDITLIGKPYKKDNPEDPKENPVIDPPPEDDNAVSIVTAEVIFSNFTIKNSLQNGIYIETSCNNTITGNTITDNNNHGILLEDSSDNNTITGNNITDNNYAGIDLWYSSDNNTITGNTIDNNGDGISLEYSSDNTITGNTIRDNNDDGIELWYSSDSNTITGNTIDNNGDGISLSGSSDNTIKDNVFQSNGIVIYGYILEHWTSHTIENNIANGRPIRYYKNTENVNVSGNTAQVILANCSNFMIQNLNLSNIDIGIQLGFSSDNMITGNTITGNNYDGIRLDYSSDNNMITGNTIRDNNDDGIGLEDSSDNTITGNDIDKNKKGINLKDASYNLIAGNNVSNNGHGMVLDINCFANTIFHNNFYQNEHSAKDDGDNVWYSIDYVEGNYWSDYKIKYPGAEDNDGDGIWDDSYLIPGDGINFDKYPFVEPLILLPPFKPSIHCDKHFITVGKSCILTIEAEDPVNQMVRYYVDWGDSEYLDSQTFYDSGEVVEYQHCFDEKGLYEVKVKAINEDGRVSDWSDPWGIAVPKNKMINHPFLIFLEQHPHLFPILRFLLEL